MSGDRVHWSMLPDADKLQVRIVKHGEDKTIECLCSEGKRYIEGGWPINGWDFHAGQCCDCMNIGVYSNGAEPADHENYAKKTDAERAWLDENYDQIHVCDLDAFIHMLQQIKKAREQV